MIFKYGSYSHAANEVSLAVSKRVHYSNRGYPQVSRVTFTLTGELIASDIASVTTAIQALEAAYSRPFQDAGLYKDDGTTPTAHLLQNAGSIGGVRVLSLQYAPGDGTQYVFKRGYTITLEADYPATAYQIVEWHEQISFRGTGGPRFVFLETLEGLPQKQIGSQRTTMKASQSGRGIGLSAYLPFSSPLWPDDELQDQREQRLETPVRAGSGAWLYPCHWNYSFESTGRLSGNPSLP